MDIFERILKASELYDDNRVEPNRNIGGGNFTGQPIGDRTGFARIGRPKGTKETKRTDYSQSGGSDFFSKAEQNKIKKSFNITDKAFASSGTKYGVPTGFNVPGEEGAAMRRKYALVKDFVNRGFKEGSTTLASGKLRKEDQLPLKKQTEIKTNYELPENYVNKFTNKREWDFKRYKYGIPLDKKNPETKKLARKIEYEFVRNPETKKFKFVGDYKTPQGWMMAQMYRSGVEQGSPNYEPKYGKVNNTRKIVGFKDNIVGETFYVRDEFNPGDGKAMKLHPDFNNVKDFIDIANKANTPLNDTLKGMLKQIGVVDDRLTMTTLLNYLAKEEGFQATNRALVLHHKGGVYENATRDLQLLRNINNQTIQSAETRIRDAVKVNQKPDKADMKILKDNRATITAGGQTFGSGPQTPKGTFRSYENFIAKKIKEGAVDKKGIVDFMNKAFGQLAGTVNAQCKVDFARGGRVNFNTGSSDCIKIGREVMRNTLQGKGTSQQNNLTKRFIAGGKNFLKSIADPRELVRLRNYIGPQALGLMAAFEGGAIGYDNLVKGTPANESLANQFLLGVFAPYSQQAAEAKNLLESGKLSEEQRASAQSVIAFDNAVKKAQNIEQMEQTQGVDIGGYGQIEGQTIDPLEIVRMKTSLENDLDKIDFNVFDTTTGKGMEYRSLADEKAATQMAKKEYSPLFGNLGTPLTNKLATGPRVRGPRTMQQDRDIDLSLPTYDRAFTPTDRQLTDFFRSEGDDRPLLPGEGTLIRMQQPDQVGLFGTQDRFSSGGIAGAKSGPAPESGPTPHGLPNLFKRVRNY